MTIKVGRSVLAVISLIATACADQTGTRSDTSVTGETVMALRAPVTGCLAVLVHSPVRDVAAEFQVHEAVDELHTASGLPLTEIILSASLYAGSACSGTPLYVAAPTPITLSPNVPAATATLNFRGNGQIVIDGRFETCASDVLLDHLNRPAVFDNATPGLQWGQTFLAPGDTIGGIRLYLGDPSRPDDPTVNELIGPADVVLFSAADLGHPIEVARTTVVPAGAALTGLASLMFGASVPTLAQTRYFVALDASDAYGIGLRSQSDSTYDGGSQATRDPATGAIEESSLGRDLSFAIVSTLTCDQIP